MVGVAIEKPIGWAVDASVGMTVGTTVEIVVGEPVGVAVGALVRAGICKREDVECRAVRAMLLGVTTRS